MGNRHGPFFISRSRGLAIEPSDDRAIRREIARSRDREI
jgi:hypothetical protein